MKPWDAGQHKSAEFEREGGVGAREEQHEEVNWRGVLFLFFWRRGVGRNLEAFQFLLHFVPILGIACTVGITPLCVRGRRRSGRVVGVNSLLIVCADALQGARVFVTGTQEAWSKKKRLCLRKRGDV